MTKKKDEDLNFRTLLANKKIPILTLDPRWHELFPDYRKNARIRNLEKQLNQLLQRQGKLVNDAKDMKKLKTRLMDGIVANMGDAEGRLKDKKQEKSQKLILDINEKVRLGDEELMQIPYRIKAVNEELLIESMAVCYEKIRDNSEDIMELAIWIAGAREELKNRILEKQDKEMTNEAMYSFMHNMLGAEVIQLFDEHQRGQLDNQE